MKRLDGEREVEKIVFGRELFYMRRRRVRIAVICFCGLCAIALLIWLFSEMKEVSWGADDTGGNTTEEKTDGQNFENVFKEPENNGNEEETTAKNEEQTREEPIIYKDFSTNYQNIVNNTVFDISFLESSSYSCAKYYDKSSKKPIVLILHTYTSDRYADSLGKYGVCAAGQTLADELNSMGIVAVYSSAVHDSSVDDPVASARETIEFYLKMYPSIKYIFDVGVMQEYDGDRVVATSGEYMGARAAQIRMLVAGNNLTTGRDNLFLASQINKNLSRGDMTLAREIVYDNSIKNSIMTPYYLEIFIGSSGNTEDEAIISSRVFAAAFAQFLS